MNEYLWYVVKDFPEQDRRKITQEWERLTEQQQKLFMKDFWKLLNIPEPI